MGMNIKCPQVHAMARELACSPRPERPRAVDANNAAVRTICARFSARPERHGRASQDLQSALYGHQVLGK